MHGIAYAAALVLAAVLATAAIAKLRDRRGTAESFGALGLPLAVARGVPPLELALAVGLVVVPGWAAIGALVLLAAFTTFLVRSLRHGVVVPCRCFGGHREEPISATDVFRNALLFTTAAIALTAGGPTRPAAGALAATVAVTTLAAAALAAARRSARR
jgi:hypothetical protein